MKRLNISYALVLLMGLLQPKPLFAQLDCYFKPPVFKIDFGSSSSTSAIHVASLDNYDEVDGTCPNDGHFSITSHTSDCFYGNWMTLMEDHTPGDVNGNMMIVNAAYQPGTFFSYPIDNVLGNTVYQLSIWIVNICTGDNGCHPTPANLSFTVFTAKGAGIIRVRTGNMPNDGKWRRYYAEFTTPPNTNSLSLKLDAETEGGCGNDFAIDDIELRECLVIKPEPPAITTTKTVKEKPVVKQKKQTENPIIRQQPAPAPQLKRTNPNLSNEIITQKPVTTQPVVKEMPVKMPEVLLTRSNALVKTIETAEAEMLIELYDNGEVDGDTVSVYHNNSLVLANAGLSEKAVKFKIRVDKKHPLHDIVMVANNLGSIPPNTSLMVITANDQRYEVFISSSKQKNARLLIKLKE
jgi:hypothetical protein